MKNTTYSHKRRNSKGSPVRKSHSKTVRVIHKDMQSKEVSVGNWGNGIGLRIPQDFRQEYDIQNGDTVKLTPVEVESDNHGEKAILIQVSKTKYQEKTIENLFKNYKGGFNQVELDDVEPLGDERW